MKRFKKTAFTFIFAFAISATISAMSFSSGYAGGKLNFCTDKAKSNFDPELSLQAFFSGQFGFTPNAWSHVEFSIDTKDLIESSIFHKTDSLFQLDELSVTFRQPLDTISNYFSIFMGTYDPIGSDIFLQRQFSINPITSKLTESWLGMAGSLLYPHFGIGLSDVIHFSSPIVAGLYIYVNHEDADYYVFNADARFACSFRLFTFDFAGGIGAPLAQKYKAEDVIVVVESLYWHMGTTLLIGNNYTQGLFLQGGIYNASFRPNHNKALVDVKDIYLLFEPRFRSKTMQIHLTAYSLPQGTVDDLLYIHDTLGLNLNIFYDQFNTQNRSFAFGVNTSISFVGKTFLDLKAPLELFTGDFNVHITPYYKTKVFNGELNAMIDVSVLDFEKKQWHQAIDINIGFKTAF